MNRVPTLPLPSVEKQQSRVETPFAQWPSTSEGEKCPRAACDRPGRGINWTLLMRPAGYARAVGFL